MAVEGEIASAIGTADVTVSTAPEVIPEFVAEIVVVPDERLFAKPEELTFAIAGAEDVQVEVWVTS